MPTVEGYFRHVPKAAILQAVGEYAPEHVTRLAIQRGRTVALGVAVLAGRGFKTRHGVFPGDSPERIASWR